jgi:predicted cupin superfamily sugar epimerase
MLTPENLIARYGLEPLPEEGGYFVQTYLSDEEIAAPGLPERYTSARPLSTAILYLLTNEPGCFSGLHRLVSDEVWHFYLGDPVEMLLLYHGGRSEVAVLGPDIPGGQQVQLAVKRNVIQGARLRPGGRFALLGTTVAPGYTPADVSFADRDTLLASHPQQAALIASLTRPSRRSRP